MRLLLIFVFVLSLYGDTLFREEFNTLENWEEITFKKIKTKSSYKVENSVLVAESNASASGLKLKRVFDVTKYPILKFRWKVDNVYTKGDATKKSGDDYPIRIYIIFDALFDKSVNYIWANQLHDKNIIRNSFTSRSMMIVLDEGDEYVGGWREHVVHMRKDFRKAFKSRSPRMVTIAIMNDSDNTGESSRSYIDFIEVSSE